MKKFLFKILFWIGVGELIQRVLPQMKHSYAARHTEFESITHPIKSPNTAKKKQSTY